MAICENHFVSDLKIHLVFVVKYRRKLITPSIKKALLQSFQDTCLSLDARLLEANGEEDHTHLLLEYAPTISVSSLVHRLKGSSARRVPSIQQTRMKVFWSDGYYVASCGGAPLDVIKAYVETQDRRGTPG